MEHILSSKPLSYKQKQVSDPHKWILFLTFHNSNRMIYLIKIKLFTEKKNKEPHFKTNQPSRILLVWHIRIETISSCSPLISLQTGLFTIATRAVSPSYEHILGRFLPVQLTIHKPRISCWPAKAQTWKHVLPLSLSHFLDPPQNKSHPLIFNRYPFIQLNCNSTRKFVIMTTVRTIDSHASTTAACSSSKEVAEWTNVWAIHSMPVETIATGWATTAEVVAAAAVPTMTISRASEDASKLGISHRYATNSLFRTTSTWQGKRVLTWLCLSRCSPSTFYWSRRYVVPLEGTDYVLFFSSWQQTFWRKPTSHPRYNEVNCIDLRRVSPRIIVTQLLHTYSLRTLFYTLWDSTPFLKRQFREKPTVQSYFLREGGLHFETFEKWILGHHLPLHNCCKHI